MKTRLITGISGALFAIACLVFMQYPVAGVALAFFSTMAAHEILTVTKCKNKALIGFTMAVAAVIPVYYDIKSYLIYESASAEKCAAFFEKYEPPMWCLGFIYMFIIFLMVLKNYRNTKFEHAVTAIFCGPALGLGMTTMLLLRDLDHVYPDYFQQAQSFTITLVSILAAWLADAFAYFFGRKFGKHKLARKISPKKSVEGLVAGVVCTALFSIAVFFVAKQYFNIHPDTLKWWMVALLTAAAVLAGVVGDLSASVIKRNYQVKDFGTFFPGHGGAMDRFDSFLFALPFSYFVITLVMNYTVK